MPTEHYVESLDRILSALDHDQGCKTDAGASAIAYGLALLADSIDNATAGIINAMHDDTSTLARELGAVAHELSSLTVCIPEGISVEVEK